MLVIFLVSVEFLRKGWKYLTYILGCRKSYYKFKIIGNSNVALKLCVKLGATSKKLSAKAATIINRVGIRIVLHCMSIELERLD